MPVPPLGRQEEEGSCLLPSKPRLGLLSFRDDASVRKDEEGGDVGRKPEMSLRIPSWEGLQLISCCCKLQEEGGFG